MLGGDSLRRCIGKHMNCTRLKSIMGQLISAWSPTMTSAQLLPEIMKLSSDDQRIIADALWRSLKADDPVDEAKFKRELEQRIEDAEKHPDEGISWDALSRELDRK